MAGNTVASPSSIKLTNIVNQPTECSNGLDKPLPTFLSISPIRGGDCKPTFLPMDTSMDHEPTIKGNSDGKFRKSPRALISLQHRAGGTDSKVGGTQNKGNSRATGGTNRVQYGRNDIALCSRSIKLCGVNLRLASNPGSGDLAISLSPDTGRQIGQPCAGEQGSHTCEREGQISEEEVPPHTPKILMNFIIWNTREANSSDFRRHCAEMVKLHKPAMLVLLKTRMTEHKHLIHELGFSSQIQSPAIGPSGGIVIM